MLKKVKREKCKRQRIELKTYKTFNDEDAIEWGKKYYGEWLPQLQNQKYDPKTPCENFFRYYTQGVDYVFNNILGYSSVDEYNFDGSRFSKEMFYESFAEMNEHRLLDNIVVVSIYIFFPI